MLLNKDEEKLILFYIQNDKYKELLYNYNLLDNLHIQTYKESIKNIMYYYDKIIENKLNKENDINNYLNKIQNIKSKISSNQIIYIYIGDHVKLWFNFIIKMFLKLYDKFVIVDFINNDTNIIIQCGHDHIQINNRFVNIFINFERDFNHPNNILPDIGIISSKEFIYHHNIYIPYLFISLTERRLTYQKYITIKKTKFCAYMYSYDLEYRIKLYHYISNNYKKIDALGKSGNLLNFIDDRNMYNDEITYNDIAVKKYSEYKFVLALENGIVDGYITEKLINPILAGSIPIYAGPSDVFNFINKKRIIYLFDFTNLNNLLNYIIKVDNDDNLYNNIINEQIYINDLNAQNYDIYLFNELYKIFY